MATITRPIQELRHLACISPHPNSPSVVMRIMASASARTAIAESASSGMEVA
jgi:hypothetical protein